MIVSLLLAALAASIYSADALSETVQNRSFYVTGWPCNGEGCQSNPRQLGPIYVSRAPRQQKVLTVPRSLPKVGA